MKFVPCFQKYSNPFAPKSRGTSTNKILLRDTFQFLERRRAIFQWLATRPSRGTFNCPNDTDFQLCNSNLQSARSAAFVPANRSISPPPRSQGRSRFRCKGYDINWKGRRAFCNIRNSSRGFRTMRSAWRAAI